MFADVLTICPRAFRRSTVDKLVFSTEMGAFMKIDFVSDVSCPWCAVGLHALEQGGGRRVIAFHGGVEDGAAAVLLEHGVTLAVELGHGQQLLAHGGAAVGAGAQAFEHQPEVVVEGGQGHFFLVLKVAVDGPFGEAGGGREVVQRRAGVALLVEDRGRLLNDELAGALGFGHDDGANIPFGI